MTKIPPPMLFESLENSLEDPFTEEIIPSTNLETGLLPHHLRPKTLSDFLGIEDILTRYPYLSRKNHGDQKNLAQLSSMVLYGPSGSGKTTLAYLLASEFQYELIPFNAVLGGVNDLKKTLAEGIQQASKKGKRPLLFIDEIHRFNKAQQDALLPLVEEGKIVLLGATTENPKTHINKALLSRLLTLRLKAHTPSELQKLLLKTLQDTCFDDHHLQFFKRADILHFITENAQGDARKMMAVLLEMLKIPHPKKEDLEHLMEVSARSYDKNGDRHYDVISAFIKSMRGSDPQASILWLAVMLDGGEDPVFIARRLLIFASEDVGNADPQALTLASSALLSVEKIGMPEARIILGQVVTYLASTQKSNRAYLAINEALAFVQSKPTIEVPDHLKNFPPTWAKKYQYPHQFEGSFVKQDYSPFADLNFYRPSEHGIEKNIKLRLEKLHSSDQG